MSGWTTSFVGGLTPLGMVMVAALPSFIATVGRPFLGATAVPVAESSAVVVDRTSTTKTTLSFAAMPRVELPWSPKASAGGEAMTTREPTFLPGSWFFSEGKRSFAPRSIPTGLASHVLVTTLPSAPLTMSALIEMRSEAVRVSPSPSVTTLETVLSTVSGVVSRVTFGALSPWVASTDTEASGSVPDVVVDEEEPPHAERVRAATSAAAAASAERRRSTGDLDR